MNNKDLPPICGFEIEINKLVNKERDSRQFEEKSRLENVNSGFACALHMHQPTIPAGENGKIITMPNHLLNAINVWLKSFQA